MGEEGIEDRGDSPETVEIRLHPAADLQFKKTQAVSEDVFFEGAGKAIPGIGFLGEIAGIERVEEADRMADSEGGRGISAAHLRMSP